MKKRSISLLIIICMLFSIMPASFAAASDVFSATVVGQEINGVNEFYGESDDVYVRNGDVVEYIFSTNNTGKEIKGYQIDVNYDAEGFEFVSFDKGNILSSEDIDIADAQLVADGVAKLVVAYQSQKSYKDSGDEVATLKLKVKDISKISDGDVSAESVVKFADNSSEDAKITLKELYPIENTIILPAMSSEKYVIGQTGSMDVKLAYGDIEFKGFEFSIANTGNVEFFEFDLDNIVWSSQIKDVANNYEASLMEDGSVKVIITFDETTKVEDNLLTIPFKVTNAQIYGEFTEYTKGFVCDNNELVFKDGYHGFTISAASIIKAEVISSAWKTVDANNQTIASIPTGGINVVYNVKFSTVDEEYKIKGVQFDVRFADINCVSDLKVDVAEFADDNLSLEAIVVNNDTVRFVAYSNDTEPVYINGDIFKISFNTTNIECDDLISVENISFTGEDMSVDTSVQKVSITDSAQTILYGYSDGKAVIPGQSVNYTIYGQAIFGNIPATVRGVNFDIEYDSDNFTFNSLEFVGLLADSEATVEYEEIEAGKIRVVYASATQEVLNGDLLTLKLDVNKKAQQNVYPIGISNVSSAPANCVTGSLGEISVESSYDEIGIYSDNVAKPGENISVNIYDYAIAITGNEFNIVYDDSILEYIDFVTGSDLDDIIDVTIEKLENKSIIKVVYVTDGSTTYTSSEDAILATLNFKVKDDATLDTRTKLIVQDNVTTPVGAFEAEFSKLEQEIHIVADYGIIRITPEKEYVLRDEYEPIIVSVDLEDIEAMRALQFDLVSKQLINAEYIDGNLSTQYDEFYVEGNRVVVGASKENAINGNLHLGRFEFEFNLMNDYANIDALAISVDGLVYDYPVKIVNGVVSIVDTLPTPTPTPSVDPTPTPSVDPTPTPSVDPTPTPSVDPTPTPSVDPTPTPSVDPTPTPSVDPTPTPSVDPTPTPSVDPTPTPSVDPTPTPTRQPPRGGSSGGSREYVVTFNAGENGVITDIKKATVDVASGKTLAATDIPEVTANDGYKFLGWSLDGKVVVDPTTEKIYKATTFTALYEKGIVSTEHLAYILGYEDGTFKPDNGITRAETAAMICRTLLGGFDEKTTYKSELSDIKASEWYANYVGFMTKSDIIKGYEDNTFRPSNEITRQEFTAIITRLGEILEAKGMPFTDVTDDLWGIDNIYTAYSMGYINGYEDKTFRPNAAITRAEAVKIINKMLDRSITEKGLVDATYKVPTDLKTSHWAYYEVIEAYNDHKYSYDDNELEIWTKKSEN